MFKSRARVPYSLTVIPGIVPSLNCDDMVEVYKEGKYPDVAVAYLLKRECAGGTAAALNTAAY